MLAMGTGWMQLVIAFWAIVESTVHRRVTFRASTEQRLPQNQIKDDAETVERGHQYDPKYEFSTWLLSIARHLTVDCLRKKKPASLDGLLG
jgi:hypothetical protein